MSSINQRTLSTFILASTVSLGVLSTATIASESYFPGDSFTNAPDYKATVKLTDKGLNHKAEIRASGPKMRITLPREMSPIKGKTVMIWEFGGEGQAMVFPIGKEIPSSKRFIYYLPMHQSPLASMRYDLADKLTEGPKANVSGESCTDYIQERQDQYGEVSVAAICITDDGIMLRQRIDEDVKYEVIELERAKQSASLFAAPEGYRELSMGAGNDILSGMLNNIMENSKQRAQDTAEDRADNEVEVKTQELLDKLFGN